MTELSYEISNWSVLNIKGEDSQRFLQGQLSQDIDKTNQYWAIIGARLDRSARLQVPFLIFKKDKDFQIVCNRDLAIKLKEDLDKFIISEDVEIEINDLNQLAITPIDNFNFTHPSLFGFCYCGKIFIAHSKIPSGNYVKGADQFEKDLFRTQQIDFSSQKHVGDLVTESSICISGVSVSKGCYLGQETASKLLVRGQKSYSGRFIVESNKPIDFPQWIKVEDQKNFDLMYLYLIKLTSSNDLVLLESFCDEHDSKLHNLNLDLLDEDKIYQTGMVKFFESSLDDFHRSNYEIVLAKCTLLIKNKLAPLEAYELLAQTLAKMNQYERALSVMDELLSLDPTSIMAHTNKSIFYLALGNIEMAEIEKAQATKKSMDKEGVDHKLVEEKIFQDQERRISMFKEVLEIDPDDEMALKGVIEILTARKMFKLVIPYAEHLSKIKPSLKNKILLLECLHKAGEAKSMRELKIKLLKEAEGSSDMKTIELINSYAIEIE
ncbi:MAG: hypothetical protein OHK0056_01100 [Bacteriovoracaceae bacterium]